MRIRPYVAAASLAVLLPALAVAAPAATGAPAPASAASAKAAQVTLKDLPAAADVGQKVAVAGTAKPATKKGKKVPVKVTVQRRYGAGAWVPVATDTTSKKGKYAVKVPLTQGGPTAFRVVRAGGGTSAVESLAVYEWLDLVDQPQVVYTEAIETRRTSTIAGTAYPDSYEFPTNEGFVIAKANGVCTSFTASTGFLDSQLAEVPDGTQVQLQAYAYTPPATPSMDDVVADKGTAETLTLDLTGARFLIASVGTSADVEADGVLASPRLRCNAAVLPEFGYEEVPL